jgi:hypothetical protein
MGFFKVAGYSEAMMEQILRISLAVARNSLDKRDR